MSTLSPEQWQVLSPYLDQVLAMTDDERAAWLVSLGEQNPTLADQLRALLDEHRLLAQEGFLEKSPGASPARRGTRGTDGWFVQAGFANRPGRNGQRVAGRAQRRSV